ncbi:MAG: FKBP-type peptidyl-prolyl cis-trans isomerase [Bacteroidia bacterium]|nr:FKBP-type peptidyl-prolyl cis-trans isomerase [Bacteroidia bacterium]
MNLSRALMVTGIVMFLITCQSSKFEGFEETENGLYYKFITQSGDTDRPQVGDYVFLRLINKYTEDSVLFSSWDGERPNGSVTFQLRQSLFKGSLEEAIMMMAAGDSAIFRISADSIYKTLPQKDSSVQFPKGTYFTFELKLIKVMTAQQMQEEQQKKYDAYLEEIQRQSAWNKENELKMIDEYLTTNKISSKALASGLHFIEHEKGKGKKAMKGSTVVVEYVGRSLVDGEIFDASEYHGQAYEFKLGTDPVIKGWEEGLSLMNAGGKATLLIPSKLGYDSLGSISPSSGMYSILPYCPLLFEVQLVEVK